MLTLLLALTATSNPPAAPSLRATPAAVCPAPGRGSDAGRRETTEQAPQSCCDGCEATTAGDSAQAPGKGTAPKPAARVAPTFTTYLD